MALPHLVRRAAAGAASETAFAVAFMLASRARKRAWLWRYASRAAKSRKARGWHNKLKKPFALNDAYRRARGPSALLCIPRKLTRQRCGRPDAAWALRLASATPAAAL